MDRNAQDERLRTVEPRTHAYGYRAWLCDLDGTLYWARPVRFAMAVEMALLGWRAVLIVWRFRREQERLREEALDGMDNPYLIQLARTANACRVDEIRVRLTIDEWMFRRPAKWVSLFRRRSLIKELQRFRAQGGCVAVVSDYPARKKLEGLGLIPIVDAIVANGESEPYRLKPRPDGYLSAAQQMGVPASECLVVGDRLDTDGVAASNARMAFRHV